MAQPCPFKTLTRRPPTVTFHMRAVPSSLALMMQSLLGVQISFVMAAVCPSVLEEVVAEEEPLRAREETGLISTIIMALL